MKIWKIARLLVPRGRRSAAAIAVALICLPIGMATAVAPVKGGRYHGKNLSNVDGVELYPISFQVSANGKTIKHIKFAIFISCGVPPPGIPFQSFHGVAIRNGRFKAKRAGPGGTTVVTGHFLSNHKAAGTISENVVIPTLCHAQGSTPWKAHV